MLSDIQCRPTNRPRDLCHCVVADTGHGIHLQQVSNYFPYRIWFTGRPHVDDDDRHLSWDGILFITTTAIEEQDIRSYSIHEDGARGFKICPIESKPKGGSTFRQALIVGKGQAVQKASWTMQACFVLMQKDREETETLVTGTDESIGKFETQVLCFEDFQYRPSRPSYAIRAIYRVDWSTFGLVIKKVDVISCAGLPAVVIVWDRPAGEIERLDLVLHRFRDSSDLKPTWKGQVKMAKSAIEAALQDLKETLPHILSTRQDVEVQKHIPTLSRCISELITSSTNDGFRTECTDILGLSPQDEGGMEQFVSAKLLQILVQRTRRDPQSAAGNTMEQVDVRDTDAHLAHSQKELEEEQVPARSWIWDFW